jgi:hypothetical protein
MPCQLRPALRRGASASPAVVIVVVKTVVSSGAKQRHLRS